MTHTMSNTMTKTMSNPTNYRLSAEQRNVPRRISILIETSLDYGNVMYDASVSPELEAKLTKGEEVELYYTQFGNTFTGTVRNIAQARWYFFYLVLDFFSETCPAEDMPIIMEEASNAALEAGMEIVEIRLNEPNDATPEIGIYFSTD